MKYISEINIRFEKFNSLKTIISMILALLYIFSACIIFPGEKSIFIISIFFAVAIIICGYIKIETENSIISYCLNIFWGIFSILFTLSAALPTNISSGILFRVFLNIVCALIIFLIIFVVNNNFRHSVTLTSLFLSIVIFIDLVVIQFRGRGINPMDLLSLTTAMNVAGQYQLVFNKRMIFVIYTTVLGIFIQFSIPKLHKLKNNIRNRVRSLLVAFFCFLFVFVSSKNISLKTYELEGTLCNGFLLNFVVNFHYMNIEEPSNYSLDNIEKYNSGYDSTIDLKIENKPNIIVIMNESFADFNLYKNPLITNKEITPYINSLSDNIIKGYALSSVFGGNTANAEFEFLTGSTMAFLPSDSVVYQQYVNSKKFSLPWYLKSKGYYVLATHPYESSGWSRTKVYPLLGMDDYTFIEDYPCENIIRNYISDIEMYEYVLNKLENKAENPMFIFGITMQNHGGYTYSGDNKPEDIKIISPVGQFPQAEQYLSLLTESDKAVEYLIEQLKDFKEETIVLFFGDHFPRIENEFYNELNGGNFSDLEEQMLRYKIPFFIWANYEIPSEYIECTSISYLSRYLLEYSGIDLSDYYRSLADIEKFIPAINANGYYSLDKGTFIPIEEATGNEKFMLDFYNGLQYNNIFDNNQSKKYYVQYIN